jgi:hypothetical protein
MRHKDAYKRKYYSFESLNKTSGMTCGNPNKELTIKEC